MLSLHGHRDVSRLDPCRGLEAGTYDEDAEASCRNTRRKSLPSSAWSAGRSWRRVSKRGLKSAPRPRSATSVIAGPRRFSIAQVCRLKPRSTYYDAPVATADEAEIVARIEAICDRVRSTAIAVSVPRCAKASSSTARRSAPDARTRPERFVATTDSDHDGRSSPTLPRTSRLTGRTSSGSPTSLRRDRCPASSMSRSSPMPRSRRVVGYAISRSIDARLTIAGAQRGHSIAVPPAGCIHHSDRGSQYGDGYRAARRQHAGRLDGAAWQPIRQRQSGTSFIKTLKVEAVYLMATKPSRTSPPIFPGGRRGLQHP